MIEHQSKLSYPERRPRLPCLYSYILTVSFFQCGFEKSWGIRFAPHTVSSHSIGRTSSCRKVIVLVEPMYSVREWVVSQLKGKDNADMTN